MDQYSNKREAKGKMEARWVSSHTLKRTPTSMNHTAQLVCSSRRNLATTSEVVCLDNLNTNKHSYHYAESRRVVVGSSSTSRSTRRLWKPLRKPIPKVENVSLDNASSSKSLDGTIAHGLKVTGDISLLENHEVGLNTAQSQSVSNESYISGKHMLTDHAGSVSSSSKFKTPHTNILGSSHSSRKHFSKSSKYNSLLVMEHKLAGLLEKGNVEGESSSSRLKKTSPINIGEISGSAHGKSIEKLRKHLYRNGLNNNSAFVITRRPALSIHEAKPSNQEYGNNTSRNQLNVLNQSRYINGHEAPVSISASMLDANTSENSIYLPTTSGNSTSSSDIRVASGLMNQGGFPRHMDSFTEILLALEHTGQVEQLSYQRLLFLEMDSFLSSLSFHDQHRDMRLDIDNMSYEELLALEDRIGCVNTAVTGEAMDKCLIKSVYKPKPSEVPTITCNQEADDLKCSICQEEYVLGDEVGRLHCEHRYHVCCIQQWLCQKNWCPICKASAVPS